MYDLVMVLLLLHRKMLEDINSKITTVEVIGSPKTGFLYNVEWFDSTFFRQLECANQRFSEKVKQDVIELAKRIDLN